MKLAIMQPYFLPYLGYFQMMNAVDKFVIYDDVNFTKRGWIHRNKIEFNGQKKWFGLTLNKASQYHKINQVELHPNRKWIKEGKERLRHRYGKTPNYQSLRPIVESWFDRNDTHLSNLLHRQLVDIKNYLEIDTELVLSSQVTNNQRLKKSDRILDTCLKLGATTYINAVGGQKLYDKEEFKAAGIDLYFIQMNGDNYSSILDWLMERDKEEIQEALKDFTLI